RGREDADSELQREKLWDWFHSDLLTRLRPDGRLILVMTRWHVDDLAGRLQQTEGHRWHTIVLPAFAQEGDALQRSLEQSLWDDDGYNYGASLFEIRERAERSGKQREFSALYMQSPRAREGNMFNTDKLCILDYVPQEQIQQTVRAW